MTFFLRNYIGNQIITNFTVENRMSKYPSHSHTSHSHRRIQRNFLELKKKNHYSFFFYLFLYLYKTPNKKKNKKISLENVDFVSNPLKVTFTIHMPKPTFGISRHRSFVFCFLFLSFPFPALQYFQYQASFVYFSSSLQTLSHLLSLSLSSNSVSKFTHKL